MVNFTLPIIGFKMHLLLIGASGLIGSKILESSLINENVSQVSLIVRTKLNLKHRKINQIILPEFSTEKIISIELPTKVDIAFCGLGTTIKAAGSKNAFKNVDCEYVVAFAKLILKNKIPSLLIVSALGANPTSKIFYSRIKGVMELNISNLGITNLYFLKPSLLIGERKNKRLGEELGVLFYQSLGRFLPRKIKNLTGTKVSDIVAFFEREITQIKPGIHQIESWD
jgi:uncharacterized protein YbjT (DUF2867 family)